MADIIPLDRLKIVGRWVAIDDWDTDVVFEFEIRNGAYTVRASDSDGEEPEVYNVEEGEDHLTFALHWSSGRFTKYRVRSNGNQLEIVFTYTDTIHLKRQTESPDSAPNT